MKREQAIQYLLDVTGFEHVYLNNHQRASYVAAVRVFSEANQAIAALQKEIAEMKKAEQEREKKRNAAQKERETKAQNIKSEREKTVKRIPKEK